MKTRPYITLRLLMGCKESNQTNKKLMDKKIFIIFCLNYFGNLGPWTINFRSTTTFKLKHRIRVCELWISFCIDDVTEITRPSDRSFVIGWPTTNVVATFKSFDLKETWLNKLTEQIQEERGKHVPKTLTLEIMNKEVDKVVLYTHMF